MERHFQATFLQAKVVFQFSNYFPVTTSNTVTEKTGTKNNFVKF